MKDVSKGRRKGLELGEVMGENERERGKETENVKESKMTKMSPSVSLKGLKADKHIGLGKEVL